MFNIGKKKGKWFVAAAFFVVVIMTLICLAGCASSDYEKAYEEFVKTRIDEAGMVLESLDSTEIKGDTALEEMPCGVVSSRIVCNETENPLLVVSEMAEHDSVSDLQISLYNYEDGKVNKLDYIGTELDMTMSPNNYAVNCYTVTNNDAEYLVYAETYEFNGNIDANQTVYEISKDGLKQVKKFDTAFGSAYATRWMNYSIDGKELEENIDLPLNPSDDQIAQLFEKSGENYEACVKVYKDELKKFGLEESIEEGGFPLMDYKPDGFISSMELSNGKFSVTSAGMIIAELEETEKEDDSAKEEKESKDLTEVYSAYKEILKQNETSVRGYFWQFGQDYNGGEVTGVSESRPVALCDVDGDDIPEMFLFSAERTHWADMHIFTYKGGEVKECSYNLYNSLQGTSTETLVDQIEAAAPAQYIVYTTKNEKGFSVYWRDGDASAYHHINTFVTDGDTKFKASGNVENAYGYDIKMQYGTDDTAWKDGKQIEVSQWEDEFHASRDALDQVIIFNKNYSDKSSIWDKVDSDKALCMTYDEMLKHLNEQM